MPVFSSSTDQDFELSEVVSLPVYQGDVSSFQVVCYDADDGTPADLSGYARAVCQIRQGPADQFPVVTEFKCAIDLAESSVIMTLAEPGARLLRSNVGYYYDLQLVALNPLRPVTILSGQVVVTPEVTR
jgi:hypothetical protein